ncbi:LysR substrate-binding domain-containing protein [Piscinibacter sakaiensis]|uniref:LysR substrate-binding domain-containing protein n=1 Tax=Piscinibacter sakaiensis TaxID=1547922 RepID=UPI003AB02476
MNLNAISLRHIRVFLVIVRERSLRRAAQALHITESAVSKSLRELENAVGVRLLQRDRRGATPTPAGETFHRHATQGAASLALAFEAVQRRREPREPLRVGALPTAAAFVVRIGVQRMFERYDDIAVHVESGHYEQLVARLRAADIDLIIGRMVSRDMVGLSFELLFDEDIVAVVRRDHPLAGATMVSIDALADYLLITPSPGTQVRAVVDSYLFASASRPLLRHLDTQSETFARAWTLESDAVWFAPRGLVTPDLEHGLVSELPLTSPLLRAPFGITTMTDVPRTRAAAVFIEIVRGVAAEQ